jgi:hypothetical protein
VLPVLSAFSHFSDRVRSFCLGWALDGDPPLYASCIAGIKDVYHYAWLDGRAGSVTQACLPSKHEAPSSNPTSAK